MCRDISSCFAVIRPDLLGIDKTNAEWMMEGLSRPIEGFLQALYGGLLNDFQGFLRSVRGIYALLDRCFDVF